MGMTELTDKWVNLFMARQKDLKLAKNLELQFARFANIVCEQRPEKPVLREQGFGLYSAKVLARILRDDKNIISFDLSMNNLTSGLEHLIEGLHNNNTIVTLRLKNNNIDGRKSQDQLFSLLYQYPSLTCVDLGNLDTIKNRNRIHNEGLNAIVDAIVRTAETLGQCLISELQL